MSGPRYLARILRLRFLNSSISDEDKVTKCEVGLDDGGGLLLFESDHSLDSSGECCQVRPTFLKGDNTPSNEIG